jgi:hypothetical protein
MIPGPALCTASKGGLNDAGDPSAKHLSFKMRGPTTGEALVSAEAAVLAWFEFLLV